VNPNKLYDWSLKYLEIRPRSAKEIRDYLKLKFNRWVKKGWLIVQPDDVNFTDLVESTIVKLTNLKLLNDEAFAKMWVESRGHKKSLKILKGELFQKGISKDIVEDVLRQFEETEGGQTELVKKAALKALPKYSKLSKQEARQKLYGFLMRRGFEWEEIKGVVDGLLKAS
jgi:regulatory protein